MSTHLLPRLGLGKMFVALPLVPPLHFPDFPSLKLIVNSCYLYIVKVAF